MGGIDRIENEIVLHGRRNNQAWFEPRMGVIPARGPGLAPEVFVAATLLTGDDVGPQAFIRTSDLGRTWTAPALSQQWFKVPMADDVYEEPWFGPVYHKKTDSLVAIGQTHFVRDAGDDLGHKKEHHVRLPDAVPSIAYSPWNPEAGDFEPWKRMKQPGDLKLSIYYAGQKHEHADGTMLIPGYYRSGPERMGGSRHSNITVLRCGYDGADLEYLGHGSVHTVEDGNGLDEPSLVFFQDKYFLTIRQLFRSYVGASADGMHFSELKPWTFDDGSDLGNYNTQQHWLKHGGRLYLVYNRRSELNNGVFRSRAPLFMAEVDPDRLCVRRDTERIVFPENGARMGNFCMADVGPSESWVISGEWLEGMFPHSLKGRRFHVESDTINYIRYIGNLLLARVHWKA